MKYKLATTALVGVLALTPAAWVRADEGATPEQGSKDHQWDASKMQKKLGLTDDQTAKLKSVMDAQMAALKPMRDTQRDLMKKLAGQVKDKASDEDIASTLKDLQANHKAMKDQIEQFRSQKEAILTPTQQAKMLLHRMHQIKKHQKSMDKGMDKDK